MDDKFNGSESHSGIFVASFPYLDTIDKLIKIKEETPAKKFILFGQSEEPKSFDGSILLIYFMATFTVGLGSLWSGYTKYYL